VRTRAGGSAAGRVDVGDHSSSATNFMATPMPAKRESTNQASRKKASVMTARTHNAKSPGTVGKDGTGA